MKRAFTLMFAAVLGALALAPVGVSVTQNGVGIVRNTAVAAPEAGGGGGSTSKDPFFTDKNCVKIALPIIGSNKCVSNSAGSGGAIVNYLRTILRLLSGAVGLVIILMLIIAGIQYITSVGEPAAIKSAKNRVVNAMTALLLFLMMFAILSFLVPGGIL